MPSGVRSWKMPRPLTVVSEMKLVAESMNKYDTIGMDCMAMNVNDVHCVRGQPR